jgi:hypothetical protein
LVRERIARKHKDLLEAGKWTVLAEYGQENALALSEGRMMPEETVEGIPH